MHVSCPTQTLGILPIITNLLRDFQKNLQLPALFMCYRNPQRDFVFLLVYGVFVFTINAEKKKERERESENVSNSQNILLHVAPYYGKVGLGSRGTWNLGLTP